MRNDNKNTEITRTHIVKDSLAEDEGALSRWSRRKQQVLKDSETESLTAPVTDPMETELEQSVLTDADMPPVDNLSEDSDYSGFLSPGVSEELRALALRKLFRSAKFNIRDGLDDYDDDFRAITLLKDVLMADATDKLNEATKQDSEDEKKEPAQAAQDSVRKSDEQDIAQDIDDDAAAREEIADNQPAERESEQNDEIKNGESGAA